MAIIVVICAVFSVTIYHFANNELEQGLLSQSQRIINQYPGFDFSQALRSTTEYKEGSHRILLNLIYFNIIVLLLSSVAGYELAKRTLRPIEESHEQQKRFTADVSHELRTPLTALKMSSEVALLDPKAGKSVLREALESDLEEANKLGLLINNLLRLTRLEARELQQSFTQVDVQRLLTEVVAEHSSSAEQKHITLKDDVPSKLTIAGDSASLKQLFGILVDNAIKYSPESSEVHLTGSQKDNVVSIVIKDYGIGINPVELPHVFERFYRADAARTRSQSSGFGLGLSIAKHISDIHRGIIHISSLPGQGTTVTVELPTTQP